jgi:predicted HicB family RNase H-like nuclease
MQYMEFGGFRAKITYVSEIETFKGAFPGLVGGADFYASDVQELKAKGAASHKKFIARCAETAACV